MRTNRSEGHFNITGRLAPHHLYLLKSQCQVLTVVLKPSFLATHLPHVLPHLVFHPSLVCLLHFHLTFAWNALNPPAMLCLLYASSSTTFGRIYIYCCFIIRKLLPILADPKSQRNKLQFLQCCLFSGPRKLLQLGVSWIETVWWLLLGRHTTSMIRPF